MANKDVKNILPRVQDAVQYFLNYETQLYWTMKIDDEFCIEPPVLNPFLRCIEALGKEVDVKLIHDDDHKAYYKISHRKLQDITSNITNITNIIHKD